MWLFFSINQMVNMGLHEERRKRDQGYTPVKVKIHQEGNVVGSLR